MTSPSVIDIDSLIQPISEDAPQGTDLREDRSPTSDYYTIKDARNSARAAERANMFDDESVDTLSLWKPVLDIAPVILAQSSKDLEVLSWYIEALIRYSGIAGLRDGLTLTREIIERYWDNLYPMPDEDGIETKVAPLTGLNGDGGEGTLLAPIRNCYITPGGNYSYWQYQQARDINKISDEDERLSRINAAGFSLADIEHAIAGGSVDFYVNLIADLEVCNQEFQAMNNLLMASCGHDAPPSTNIRELLDELLRSIRFLTKDKLAHLNQGESADGADTADNGTGATTMTATSGVAGSKGPIASREDALNRLQEVARYFRAHEPHSPLAPAVERIVSWGRMNVAELMMELVPDSTARAVLTQLTGVKLDGSDDSPYVPPPVTASRPEPAEAEEQDSGGVSW